MPNIVIIDIKYMCLIIQLCLNKVKCSVKLSKEATVYGGVY